MCNKALWPVETRAVCIIVCIVKFGVPNVRNGSSVMAKDAGGGVLSEIVCGTVLWIHGRVCVCSGSLLKACHVLLQPRPPGECVSCMGSESTKTGLSVWVSVLGDICILSPSALGRHPLAILATLGCTNWDWENLPGPHLAKLRACRGS